MLGISYSKLALGCHSYCVPEGFVLQELLVNKKYGVFSSYTCGINKRRISQRYSTPPKKSFLLCQLYQANKQEEQQKVIVNCRWTP